MHRRNFLFGSLAASVAGLLTGRKREAVAKVPPVASLTTLSQSQLLDLRTSEDIANQRYPFHLIGEISADDKALFLQDAIRMTGTFNSKPIGGFSKRHLLFVGMDGSRRVDGSWQITLKFEGHWLTNVVDPSRYYNKADFSCFGRFFDGLEIVPYVPSITFDFVNMTCCLDGRKVTRQELVDRGYQARLEQIDA